MIQENDYIIDDTLVGLRLDKTITLICDDLSRNAAQQLIDEENILVNGVVENKKYTVKNNDVVTVRLPELKELSVDAENIPLDIVYEDEHLLVVNKPKGMVVHPAVGNYNGTLVNALLYHCGDSLSGINGVIRPGIVHRIDKDTSGLLIVAKNDIAHKGLAEQIKDHSFTREYKTACFFLSFGCLPIGASIVPLSSLTLPTTTVLYSLVKLWSLICSARPL